MLHRHKKDNLSEMPGFLLGGLTVLICGEASMLSASIRKMFNTSWFAVYLQKTLHFLVFHKLSGSKLANMNLLIEFIKINKALKAKS